MALRTYQRCREVLAEEFGVDPLPETSELYDQILNDELD
jgi:DNA-binding SARP family transcriptional activator